jgi:hypothetical protein
MTSGMGPDATPHEAGAEAAPPTVFISHASEDHAVAEQVCRLLEQDGVGCWIAPRNVDAGREYGGQIIDGIESTRVMVLLLSAPANASTFVSKEVERAVSKGKVVIPFRIQDVRPSRSLELFISSHQWLDAWTPPLEARVHVLAAAIRGLLSLPPLQGDEARAAEAEVPYWLRSGSRRRLSGLPLIAGLGIGGFVVALLAIVGGLLLMGRGGSATSPSASAALGEFTATGSMSAARGWPTVARLKDGRVLVMGGWDNAGALATAELYDPTTGTFTPAGSMPVRRGLATATLLDDGRVLVVGGQDEQATFLSSAELYDPATGTFSPTPSMAFARNNHTATKLADGRVLITGGWDTHDSITASAEVYDPATGRFSQTGSMMTERACHSAALLSNGRVLIAGGQNLDYTLGSAELYDPASGTFTQTGSLQVARVNAPAVALASGRVLIAGGDGGGGVAIRLAEIYDPTSGLFSPTGSLSTPRQGVAASVMSDGRVLIAGGRNDSNVTLSSAEVFDPASGSFSPAGSMTTARHWPVAAPLTDGRVLIVGGENAGGNVDSVELYKP